MLVLDTNVQEKWRGATKVESSHELRRKSLEHEIKSNTITVSPDGDRDITKLEARMGRPMTCQQVIDRLKLCNSNLVFELSNADRTKMGVYVMRDERQPTGGIEKRKVFLFGMESCYMPEFNIVHVAKKQVPNPELLGNPSPTRDVNWISVDTYGGGNKGLENSLGEADAPAVDNEIRSGEVLRLAANPRFEELAESDKLLGAKMSETSFTYSQVQELIKTAVETAISASNKMNPMDQKKYDAELDREHRRDQMMIQLGKIEEEATRRRKDGCTHLRYTMSAGRRAGEMAPKGVANAEWMTGGQAYQNGTASVICLRCQTVWLFKPTPEYYSAIQQNGLLGEAPPPDEHTICIGCFELKKSCKCDEVNAAMKATKTAN